ncbi:MAG: endo-1,4-beta-xylanase [Acidobacteriota bacterium]|nr:MAG: endo-1,4-beta-xylanase [Acidobacteriota bacterium]
MEMRAGLSRIWRLKPVGTWIQSGRRLSFVSAFLLLVGTVYGEPLSRADILAGIDNRIERYRKVDIELLLRDPEGAPLPPGTSVRVTQIRQSFLFGSNIFLLGRADTPSQEAAYRQRFAEIFNFATLPFYWWSYERDQGKPDTERTEGILQWTEEQGIQVKGHPLAWNFVDPRWLPEGNGIAQQLQMDRIESLVGQFRGRIDIWDVVNEATSAEREETLQRSPILTKMIRAIGIRQYLHQAFQRARMAGQEAALIINDYEVGEEFRTRVLEEMLDSGREPIFDIVGIQSHQHRGPWSVEKIWEVCERFAGYGKPLHFTETTFLSGKPGWYLKREDPDLEWESTAEGEVRQAREVEVFYRVLFSHPAVQAITWWDFSDQKAWQGAPAGLLRKDMSPKPAYSVLERLIKQDWSTRLEAIVDDQGRVRFRGFKGSYELEINVEAGRRSAEFSVETDLSRPLEIAFRDEAGR